MLYPCTVKWANYCIDTFNDHKCGELPPTTTPYQNDLSLLFSVHAAVEFFGEDLVSAWGWSSTVKASNFGPHWNFGPLFQKGLLSLKCILQKNEDNKSCRKSVDLRIWLCSFLVHNSSKEAIELAKKKSKVSMRSKVRALYGTCVSSIRQHIVPSSSLPLFHWSWLLPEQVCEANAAIYRITVNWFGTLQRKRERARVFLVWFNN